MMMVVVLVVVMMMMMTMTMTTTKTTMIEDGNTLILTKNCLQLTGEPTESQSHSRERSHR